MICSTWSFSQMSLLSKSQWVLFIICQHMGIPADQNCSVIKHKQNFTQKWKIRYVQKWHIQQKSSFKHEQKITMILPGFYSYLIAFVIRIDIMIEISFVLWSVICISFLLNVCHFLCSVIKNVCFVIWYNYITWLWYC